MLAMLPVFRDGSRLETATVHNGLYARDPDPTWGKKRSRRRRCQLQTTVEQVTLQVAFCTENVELNRGVRSTRICMDERRRVGRFRSHPGNVTTWRNSGTAAVIATIVGIKFCSVKMFLVQ